MKRTPFYDLHIEHKAHMEEFGGWEMPIYYSDSAVGGFDESNPYKRDFFDGGQGIIAEHMAVRKKVGFFDICHMGRFKVNGSGASDLVQRLTTNDVLDLREGCIQYSLVCNDEGGILDDILVYRLKDGYLLVVNAGNRQVISSWFRKWSGRVEVRDISDEMGMIAIQGPMSEKLVCKLAGTDISALRYYCFRESKIGNIESLISRTGYTGEDGFEIYFDSGMAEDLWSELSCAGESCGLRLIGLGARDTLRLEASLPLYGHELTTKTNPLEAGLEKFVKLDKGEFTGRKTLLRIKENGLRHRLVGFEMIGRAIPRAAYTISKGEKDIGMVTSGSFSPSLGRNIGLGYVETEYSCRGCELEIRIRNKPVEAKVVKIPFYKRS